MDLFFHSSWAYTQMKNRVTLPWNLYLTFWRLRLRKSVLFCHSSANNIQLSIRHPCSWKFLGHTYCGALPGFYFSIPSLLPAWSATFLLLLFSFPTLSSLGFTHSFPLRLLVQTQDSVLHYYRKQFFLRTSLVPYRKIFTLFLRHFKLSIIIYIYREINRESRSHT